MIKKNILKLTILFLLFQCGYQPIYSNKTATDLNIKKIIFLGEKKINQKIFSFLRIEENSNENDALTLSIESDKNRIITSKDSSGNALTYKLEIKTNLILSKNENIFREKSFKSSFKYSNQDNKFNLREYEKNVEDNIAKLLADQISTFLRIQ